MARTLIGEAEELINAGSVGHNHLYVYQQGCYLAMEQRDSEAADRYLKALETFAGDTGWPRARFTIDLCRALTRYGRGERDDTVLSALKRLRQTVVDYGLWEPGFDLVSAP